MPQNPKSGKNNGLLPGLIFFVVVKIHKKPPPAQPTNYFEQQLQTLYVISDDLTCLHVLPWFFFRLEDL